MHVDGSSIIAGLLSKHAHHPPPPQGAEGFTYNYYEDLTPDDVLKIVDTLRKGGKPKLGSQHRAVAEPAGAIVGGTKWVASQGTMTLSGPPRAPYCRDLDKSEPPPPPPPAK